MLVQSILGPGRCFAETNEGFEQGRSPPVTMEAQKGGDKSQMYPSLKFSEQYASGACTLCSLRARCAIAAFPFDIAFHSKTGGVEGRVRGYLLAAHLDHSPKPAEQWLGPASLCRAGAAIRNLALGCARMKRKGMGK